MGGFWIIHWTDITIFHFLLMLISYPHHVAYLLPASLPSILLIPIFKLETKNSFSILSNVRHGRHSVCFREVCSCVFQFSFQDRNFTSIMRIILFLLLAFSLELQVEVVPALLTTIVLAMIPASESNSLQQRMVTCSFQVDACVGYSSWLYILIMCVLDFICSDMWGSDMWGCTVHGRWPYIVAYINWDNVGIQQSIQSVSTLSEYFWSFLLGGNLSHLHVEPVVFSFKICHFRFHENAYSNRLTIFKAFFPFQC